MRPLAITHCPMCDKSKCTANVFIMLHLLYQYLDYNLQVFNCLSKTIMLHFFKTNFNKYVE